MTQQDKYLLLRDLSPRLPYGCKIKWDDKYHNYPYIIEGIDKKDILYCKSEGSFEHHCMFIIGEDIIKPYLRPMSSMTKEEMEEYNNMYEEDRKDILPVGKNFEEVYRQKQYDSIWEHPVVPQYRHIAWLNAHHFDYRGLIPMGLALEAPEGMYK